LDVFVQQEALAVETIGGSRNGAHICSVVSIPLLD
jgi:hypothetical protein